MHGPDPPALADAPPDPATQSTLASEVAKSDLLGVLIASLPSLHFETRKDAAAVFNGLMRVEPEDAPPVGAEFSSNTQRSPPGGRWFSWPHEGPFTTSAAGPENVACLEAAARWYAAQAAASADAQAGKSTSSCRASCRRGCATC